jgi:hypothetical protein
MIKRLGGPRPKHPAASSSATASTMRTESFPQWKVQALVQLRAISSALHSSQKPNTTFMSRGHPRDSRLRDLDHLVEGFGKMDLGCIRGDLVGHDCQY